MKDFPLPLRSARDLEQAVQALGILPFFHGAVPGLSVQELVDPALWFSDDLDGPWEWKGPVIAMGRTAYGKFLKNKAVYMRLDLYADFLTYRRACYPTLSQKPVAALGDLSEASLFHIVQNCGSILSSELKEMLGIGRPHKRTAADLVDVLGLNALPAPKGAASALDTMLSNLQMSGRLCIEGFEYQTSKTGSKYGWGLARYTTPEALYTPEALDCHGRDPLQSRTNLQQALIDAAPQPCHRRIFALIG